jgi:hypothetical protein
LHTLKCIHRKGILNDIEPLYVWKILEGPSPNCGLKTSWSERRGREVIIPPSKGTGRVQSLREGSFQVHGARLFNSLPKHIRNTRRVSTDELKEKLDIFLQSLPVEPKSANYIPSAGKQSDASPSNSIIDQNKAVRTRRPG